MNFGFCRVKVATHKGTARLFVSTTLHGLRQPKTYTSQHTEVQTIVNMITKEKLFDLFCPARIL